MSAIERCDIAIVVLDGTKEIEEQDKRIAGYAREYNRGLIIVVNKWDSVKKDDKTMKEYEEKLEYYLTHERERINIAINGYKKVVDYQITFPLSNLFDKKALSTFMKQRNISDSDKAAALYLKEGADNESYSTIYRAFMKIKNDINLSDFQTEVEYFEYYLLHSFRLLHY